MRHAGLWWEQHGRAGMQMYRAIPGSLDGCILDLRRAGPRKWTGILRGPQREELYRTSPMSKTEAMDTLATEAAGRPECRTK